MSRFSCGKVVAAALVVGSIHLSTPLTAAAVPGALQVARVATGFDFPVLVTSPPRDRDRLFVVEQSGRIRILRLETGDILERPFLDLSSETVMESERGLLGLAFHPWFPGDPRFFVAYTDLDGHLRVRSYSVSEQNGDEADPASAVEVLTIEQPHEYHNGGWLGFGPEGHLYLTVGDGGHSFDKGPGHDPTLGNAQDLTENLLGKILRLDVDGDDFPGDPRRTYAIPPDNPFTGRQGDDEIWAYGVRNPWRASFDRQTGDFWFADVGERTWEEVNVEPYGGTGGTNYGWRLREGTDRTPNPVGGPRPPGAVDPIYQYDRRDPIHGGIAVIGGHVYRGPDRSLHGVYFFSDFVARTIRSLRWDRSDPSENDGANYLSRNVWSGDRLALDEGSIDYPVSFGEDAFGCLYLVDYDGDLFRIGPPGPYGTGPRAAILPALSRAPTPAS